MDSWTRLRQQNNEAVGNRDLKFNSKVNNNYCFDADIGQTDLLIPALHPSVPSLVTNDLLQKIIPKLSRTPIAQELSTANAQQGLIVVKLHHQVQLHQQRVTDRCLFRNPSHPPCSVSVIRNRFIQSNESIRISGFTQSCLQASLQASTPQPTRMGATREQQKDKQSDTDRRRQRAIVYDNTVSI